MNIRQTFRKWSAYQRTLRELNALDHAWWPRFEPWRHSTHCPWSCQPDL